jgi:hypothetical protein
MYPVVTSAFGTLLTHEIVGRLLEQLEKAVEVLNVEIAKSSKIPHIVSAEIESVALLCDTKKSYQLSEVKLAITLSIEGLATRDGSSVNGWSVRRLVSYRVGDPDENQMKTLYPKQEKVVSLLDIYHAPFDLVMLMYYESGTEEMVSATTRVSEDLVA